MASRPLIFVSAVTPELKTARELVAGPNWFVSLFFNGACFVRRDGKTRLRSDWREHANDVSDSIDAEVARMPHFSGHSKTFEEWCEDMISNFGDEIAPELRNLWQDIHRERIEREREEGAERRS